MKIPNKKEFQQIALNHSADVEFNGFLNPYQHYKNHFHFY